VVSEIRIYVEGGGDHSDTKAKFRQGMSQFLDELKKLAQERNIRWSIIACGSRNSTLQDFRSALNSHPQALNVLLVDTEAPVTASTCVAHLQNRDSWNMTGIAEKQCYLMVEVMENWFLADVDTLADFYGQRFNQNAIPPTQNVEQIAKSAVETALTNATRNTQKGEYHKIRHGTQLLAKINPVLVCNRAPNCNRLFSMLRDEITPKTPK
jgi:hypothetical protein